MTTEDKSQISDGYHTFEELYNHRYALFIALCNSFIVNEEYEVIKAKKHFDGLDVWNEWGMFLLQVETEEGQISYHIPNKFWDDVHGEEQQAHEWDGHTSNDVINRLIKL